MNKPSDLPISVADWHDTPTLQMLVVKLWERLQQLEQRVAQLEQGQRGGGKGSSGQTAKKGDPAKPARRGRSKRRSSGRSPGAQPGHEGHGRSLLPVEQVQKVVPVKPEACHQCGQLLCGDDAHPRRHQVVEIPPVQVQVTEYQLHTLRCAHCETLTEASWPDGVPPGAFGPGVQAWVGLLSGAYRMSKRNIKALMSDAFGIEMALGTVSQLERRLSEAVAGAVEKARAFVRRATAVNIDETSWREHRAKAWLWTAATNLVTVFAIRLSRGTEVARELLGDVATGVVGSDRYTAYSYLSLWHRQICWAHLKRTFEAFVECGGEAAGIGTILIEQVETLFTWWHRVRDGTLERSSFQTYVSTLRHQVHMQLLYGTLLADDQTAATCANLLKVETALWTFVRKEGVEPTNNTAERALRHGVIWRHTSFGTHSPDGSRFVERMLTVRATLHQQKRNVLHFLTQTCKAALHNQPPPSLLP